MESRPPLLLPLLLPSPDDDFPTLFTNLHTLILSSPAAATSAFVAVVSPKPSRAVLQSLPLLDRSLLGACAGGLAGAFTYLALLPIDAVKTLLQTRGSSAVFPSAASAALHILRTSGPLGFYRGASAVALGSALSSALYFGTCELAKPLLSPLLAASLVPPVAGASGNIVSSAIMVPKELITQRVQAGAAARSWRLLLHILRHEGFLGLYAGYSATLLRNLPTGVLSYSTFEYAKAFILGLTGQAFLQPAQSVMCGALAGAVSASLTTPLDVIKTRLMTDTKMHHRGISDAVRVILTEEGWVGLTRGIGPRVLHSACFAAIGYCAFETTRLALLKIYLEKRGKLGEEGR